MHVRDGSDRRRITLSRRSVLLVGAALAAASALCPMVFLQTTAARAQAGHVQSAITEKEARAIKCAVFRFRMRTAQNIIDCYAPDFGYVSYEASSWQLRSTANRGRSGEWAEREK